MPLNLKGRSILTLDELTPSEIRFLLRLAAGLKAAKHAGTEQPRLQGKNTALTFEKVSESAASIAFDRAENRMPTVKAVVVATIGT